MNALKRPHFRNPPIHEQVISLGFERVGGFDTVDHGLFWQQIRDQFPVAETVQRSPQTTEITEGQPAMMSWELMQTAEPPRSHFKNMEAGELVQLQDNQLAFNWIRGDNSNKYPRFERTSERLWEIYNIYIGYLDSRRLSLPVFRQCEISNINIVPVKSFGEGFEDIINAFQVDPFDWQVPGLIAETYVRRRQHRIVDGNGNALGRLHSVISPAFGQNGEKVFQFELTARSFPKISGVDDAKYFLDIAHGVINGAFLASVTDKMLNIWEKYDG